MSVIKEVIIMITIENTQECFVQLWLRLERTRQLLQRQCKRFCIRNVLKTWFGFEASNDVIWEVCREASADDDEPICGYDILPPPSVNPRQHRELLRAILQVRLGLKKQQVRLRELDKAYSTAFPNSTPINVNKKKYS